MRAKIKYSTFAIALTAIVSGALYIGCFVTLHQEGIFFTLLSILLILYICGLLYGAAYIKVTDDNIVLGSLLKSKKLPIQGVESVELFQPTMGTIRICASGGFMGYWGIFKEGDIGRYYGFYGKASDCFLIRMKNGDKYVLGCENPAKVVDYIKSQMKS